MSFVDSYVEFPRTVQFKPETVGYQLRQLIKQFETESLESWIELARNEKLDTAFQWENVCGVSDPRSR